MLAYLVFVFRFAFASGWGLDFRLAFAINLLTWIDLFTCVFSSGKRNLIIHTYHRSVECYAWFCFMHFHYSLFVVLKLSVLYWFFVWFRFFILFSSLFIFFFASLMLLFVSKCLTDTSDKWYSTWSGSHLSLFIIFQSDQMFCCFYVIELTSMDIFSCILQFVSVIKCEK